MLDPFYPIVESADWVRRLVGAGARLIQLRIKDKDSEFIHAAIRAAKKFCAAQGAQLVVNDHWQIALEEGCNFIHLGQQDLQKADLKAIRKAKMKLGISTHSPEELSRALGAQPDYVALGPIYPTSMKEMPWQPQGLDPIKKWKKMIRNLPLVAIGGITLERAPLCLKAGANSVAVVTDIVSAENPEQRARDWIAATRTKAAA